MSYKVLARKWRPKNFDQLVGQEHVLKALVNALDNDRLHHAYLFTGTRGVGKTTIARILAKCLNCEEGVSSSPCNQCQSCLEVDSGRFIDLIEVDAASRTKVEDTRELLDNVQYAPTRGRYKVYLIDEVHMLSGHSFNALLKTLEEPPPHVKFLLATTDPQKLPVTVLSRCLQFNLKALSVEKIAGQLKTILTSENVPFEESALWVLSRAANGSMRDALSLTDQAISFGEGKLGETEVRDMLGTVDVDYVHRLLNAIAESDPTLLLQEVDHAAEQSADFNDLLAEMITVLHRIAVAQIAPDSIEDSQGDKAHIMKLSEAISPENVQLYYQIALVGRRDQDFVPDPRSGFEMTLLRMLTFKPDIRSQDGKRKSSPEKKSTDLANKAVNPGKKLSASERIDTTALQYTANILQGQAAKPSSNISENKIDTSVVINTGAETGRSLVRKSRNQAQAKTKDFKEIDSQEAETYESWASGELESQDNVIEFPLADSDKGAEPEINRKIKSDSPLSKQESQLEPNPVSRDLSPGGALSENDNNEVFWDKLVSQLDIKGACLNLARNCVLVKREKQEFVLSLSSGHEPLLTAVDQKKLEEAIALRFGSPLGLSIKLESDHSGLTPDNMELQRKKERFKKAELSLREDPHVKILINDFSASLLKDSIEVLD